MEQGGLVKGPSHDQGGVKMEVGGTGTRVELEGGEGVINKTVMSSREKVTLNGQDMTPCEAASELNQMDGNGVPMNCYERGGMVELPIFES
jgi:hypothetical protein